MPDVKHVERSAVNTLQVVMHDIIKEDKLKFYDKPLVDSRIVTSRRQYKSKQKYPDLVLENKSQTKKCFLIEFKDVTWNPYEPELVDDAYLKSSKLGIKYFATSNFNKIVLWRADLSDVPLMERHIAEYELVKLRNLNDLKRANIITQTKRKLKLVLKEFELIFYGKITIRKKAIDEFFIELLRTAIDTYFISISEAIQSKCKTNKTFRKKIAGWFLHHGWNFDDSLDNYDKVAKQYLLLLLNKILFYNALKLHYKEELKKIELSEDESLSKFNDELKSYFSDVLEIDYESVYSTNFLETIPIPNELIPRLASFINNLSDKYDFSGVNYDIMGRIFENLIPLDERHRLGQFYTNSNVVDLINAYCIKNEKDLVLDAGCGAGTFLVRAYNLKRLLNPTKKHKEIIEELYGFDISKFASHLTNINLSIRDLSTESYPRIINDDFFDIKPNHLFKEYFKSRTLSGALVDIEIPKVDAVIGNPPYTRQEEIKQVFGEKYKDKINKILNVEFGVKLDGTASVYAHFFIHGSAFLKDKGRFGYITANTWLDAGYGEELKQFFLDNYKIIAIIESKVERWFEYADINTVIIILEKCSEKKERENNKVKFVLLKDKLENYFHNIDITEDKDTKYKKEKLKLKSVKKLISQIDKQKEMFEGDSIKIILRKQSDLESTDTWTKYLKAPSIYFRLLEDSSFVKIGDFTDKVRYGLKTGAEKFFYLNDKTIKTHKIEKRYLKPVITSPRESTKIEIDKNILPNQIIWTNLQKSKLKDTNLLSYIRLGEKEEYHKRTSIKNRKIWFSFGEIKPYRFVVPRLINEVFTVYENTDKIIIDDSFSEFDFGDKFNDIISGFCNTTLFYFIMELNGTHGLGQGALFISTKIIKNLPVINPEIISKRQYKRIQKAINKIKNRDAQNIFNEIKMKDRKDLDKIYFDILKLTNEERKEIYFYMADLVKSRLERASSVNKAKNNKTISEQAIVENVLNEIDTSMLKDFPNDYLPSDILTKDVITPNAEVVTVESDLQHGIYVKADDEIIKCDNKFEAQYIQFLILNKKNDSKIPVDIKETKKIVKEYSKILNDIKKSISNSLTFYVSDDKLFGKLKPKVFREIFKINK